MSKENAKRPTKHEGHAFVEMGKPFSSWVFCRKAGACSSGVSSTGAGAPTRRQHAEEREQTLSEDKRQDHQ